MDQDIKTVIQYPVGATEFDIPFDYLSRKFVRVSLVSDDNRRLLSNITEYRYVSKTRVKLLVATTGFDRVEIRRFTSASERIVDFSDGSVLRAADLNVSQIQSAHIAEEARDAALLAMPQDDAGNLDARNRRIVRLAPGVDDTDAINKNQLDTTLGEAGGILSEVKAEKQDFYKYLEKFADDSALVRGVSWVYNSGSAMGGETAIVINKPTDVFAVPYIEINGDRQEVGYHYDFDASTQTLTLTRPLVAGDFLMAMTTESHIPLESLLAGTTGATSVGTKDGTTVQDVLNRIDARLGRTEDVLAYRETSILEYMNETDVAAIMTTTGTVDVNYALKAAVSAGERALLFPVVRGAYGLGSSVPANMVQFPIGMRLRGLSWKPYTYANQASLNDTMSTIRVNSGAPAPFYGAKRMTLRDLNFDGRDRTTQLLYSPNSSEQFNGTRIEGCGIYSFNYGLGWSNYVGTLFCFRVSVTNCNDAVRNPIDSSFIGCVFNANNRGVNLQSGANNNAFIGCRNEWNNGDNYFAFNAVENIIIGELCDRAGRGGVVASGSASWYLNGVVVRRSGANQDLGTDYSANFVIIDSGIIVLNGCRTAVGANDSGDGGVVTPSFLLSTLGSGGGTFIAAGSDLSGYRTKSHNEKGRANLVVTGCLGFATIVNVGKSLIIDGRACTGFNRGNLQDGAGSTLTLAVGTTPPDQYETHPLRTLLVETRLPDGRDEHLMVPLIFQNELSISVRAWAARVASTSTRIGITEEASGVVVSFSVSPDGNSLNVVLTSKDGISRKVRATLLPN